MRDLNDKEIRALFDVIFETVENNNQEVSECIQIISKAIKSLGRRLEMLEEHVYNERDDDDYLN